MSEWMAELREALPAGHVRSGVPFSKLTTWKVGGPAEILVEPQCPEEAARVIHLTRREGLAPRIVGRGSNLLVSDEGVAGVVIRPSGGFDAVRFDGTRVVAEPGRGLSTLAEEAARRGLAGLEFGIGIPGSLGGAVAVNAGAEGSDLAGAVESVVVLRRSGEKEVWSSKDLRFGYRRSRLLDEPALVMEIALVLRREDPERVERRTRELRAKRSRQPAGRSAGSVFRNPEGEFAGRLLDAAGAKGMRVGGAVVSDEHANFILTEEGASAGDVLILIGKLQEKVARASGVLLVPEVVFAGFAEDDRRLPTGARPLRPIT